MQQREARRGFPLSYSRALFHRLHQQHTLRCTLWKKSQNYVELWGTAGAAPSFSHENHGESFYRFPLRVERLSGQSDLPLILAPSTLLEGIDIAEGTPLRVTGQPARSTTAAGTAAVWSSPPFAQSIEPCDGGHFNRILLSGVLCKQPTLRRTPLGRSICDMILAVNRRYGRADYLPCIAWGKVAAKIAEMQVGDRLTLEAACRAAPTSSRPTRAARSAPPTRYR